MGSCAGNVYGFDVATGELRWSYDVSADGATQFHGSPWISDTILIVGTDMGNEQNGSLYALQRLTGRLLWKREWDTGLPSNIVGADSLVYLIAQSDEVSAVRVRDGTTRWSFETGWKQDDIPAGEDGRFHSMLQTDLQLINGTLYFAGRNFTVFALDALTGATKWVHPVPAAVTTQLLRSDSVLFVGTESPGIEAISIRDGRELYSHVTDLIPIGGMARSGDLLYYLSGTNPLRPTEVIAHNLSTGQLAWAQTSPGIEDDAYWFVPRIHLWRDDVVVGTSHGHLTGLDRRAGDPKWSHEMDGAIRGIGHSGDSLLLVGTFQGILLALRPVH